MAPGNGCISTRLIISASTIHEHVLFLALPVLHKMLLTVPAIVQETACVGLTNKPIHGGEDVAASGEELASGVAVVGQHYHGSRVGRIAPFSQEGEHVVHILVAALKLMGGASVICSTHESSAEGQR